MKRIVYSLLTLGATLALAFSCTKEPEAPNPDPSFGGTPVKVTFNVDLRGALTKADTPETTDLDNAAGDYRLYVAAFSKTDGSLISTSRIGGTGYEATGTVTDGKGTVTLTLSKKQEYQVVFFAQKDESYAVDFASGNKAQFSYKTGLKANDATLDAFWAVLPVSSATTTYDVTLKRPFAQLNVLVPADNVPEGQTTFNSTMKVKAPTAFDLFAGSATGTVSEIEFASNGINAPAFGKYKTGYAWIGMNYVLVPTAGTVEVVSFNENGMQKPVAPGAVPVKVNSRTNMVGNLYSMDADFTFNITINPATEEEGEDPLGGTDTEVTIADGATYTENSPLEINASAATKSVTLTINGSEKISDVEEASGEKVTATTSDDKVATAAVSGDNVVITGVGNGDAVITVTTPSYTKATYKGGALAIPVRVSGFKSDVAITVTAPTGNKLALVTGKTGTITATAKDAAGNAVDIVYTSSDEKVATVTAGTVTAVAAGSATITLSTEATATLNAAESKTVTVTVTDEEAPATVTKTLPYSENFTTGIGDFTTDNAIVEGSETKVWIQSTQYGMVATSYVKLTGADAKTNNAAESWLISPLIDLGSATAPAVSFEHATNYFTDVATAATEATVWVKEESATTWTQLAPTYPSSLSFTYVSSGEVDLTAYKGKKIQIAFKYTSTATKSGTWEIKNFKVEDASTPIETTISFAKETLELTVGSSSTNTLTTNSTGAVTYSSSVPSVATVDDMGKVTAVAEGSAVITVSIAADGRYTAASDTYNVTVSAAPSGSAPVGTVLWGETWTGASDGTLVDAYAQGGTSVYGSASVTYAYAGGTKIYVDNNMDGSTNQENLMLGRKANDVSGNWAITGIPTGGASKAILKIYTNNANTFKSDLITVTSGTSGVTVGAKTQGSESAKPFTFTYEIELGSASTIDLTFTNGHSSNVRIDDITLTVSE